MAQIWAAINPAQEYKWPIPMASLLFGSVSVQASKGDTFSEALYMENALMQQPSHMYCINKMEK